MTLTATLIQETDGFMLTINRTSKSNKWPYEKKHQPLFFCGEGPNNYKSPEDLIEETEDKANISPVEVVEIKMLDPEQRLHPYLIFLKYPE